jgi:hypothetical protein
MAESPRKSQETITFEHRAPDVVPVTSGETATMDTHHRKAMLAIFLAVFVANFAMVVPAALSHSA